MSDWKYPTEDFPTLGPGTRAKLVGRNIDTESRLFEGILWGAFLES